VEARQLFGGIGSEKIVAEEVEAARLRATPYLEISPDVAKKWCQSALKWDPGSARKRNPSFLDDGVRPEAMRGAIGVAQRIDGGRPERFAIKRGF